MVLFLLSPARVRKIFSHLDAKEEEKRVEAFRPLVRAGDTVLDVGAGSGRFGKVLQERLKLQVTGVDIYDYSDHSIPFFIYDGKKLPFSDKSFDAVFFAFVLHHIRHQEEMMQEACRVARKQIIIFEDVYTNTADRLFTCWNDWHNNVLQGWVKARKGYLKGSPSKMPMPLTFRTVQGWRDFFKPFPVEILSQEMRKSAYKPLTKTHFCLKVKNV